MSLQARLRGPFGYEANNATRTFEYPWAYHSVPIRAGDNIVEIGGGLSGFQFVLSKAGCKVTNVDPGGEGSGSLLPLEEKNIASLNRWFGTNVKFVKQRIETLELDAESQDRVYTISVIEHLTFEEIERVVDCVFRILKKGGFLVMTVDLFLNLLPFTSRVKNEWGTNVDLRWLSRLQPLEVAQGLPSELFGFPEFDPQYILSNLEKYMIGLSDLENMMYSYPCLTQCLVLRKPEQTAAMLG